jgi:hypothetical protein
MIRPLLAADVDRWQLGFDQSAETAIALRRAVRLLKRLFQRLLILGLGILSIWLIVFVIFETADRRLPWLLALGFTY